MEGNVLMIRFGRNHRLVVSKEAVGAGVLGVDRELRWGGVR